VVLCFVTVNPNYKTGGFVMKNLLNKVSKRQTEVMKSFDTISKDTLMNEILAYDKLYTSLIKAAFTDNKLENEEQHKEFKKIVAKQEKYNKKLAKFMGSL
jgi:uncharacterized membrane protein YjjP (DUF1212 family)